MISEKVCIVSDDGRLFETFNEHFINITIDVKVSIPFLMMGLFKDIASSVVFLIQGQHIYQST